MDIVRAVLSFANLKGIVITQMADRQPSAGDAAAVKKKRRVKKKPAEPKAEEPLGPEYQRPIKRHPLSFADRQHFDYIRELTSKNVW